MIMVKDEIQDANGPKLKTPSPLHSSTPPGERQTDRTAEDKKKSALVSSPTMSKFWQIAEVRDEISRAVRSSNSHNLKERLSGLAHKISWDSLKIACKEWFRNPMNLALFAWMTCVSVSGAILFLVMTGMLNSALPNESQRNVWFEVNNQILNALFTLMCLYQHPKRFHQLAMLLRWKPEDISRLRKIYCKNGTYKPHEWAHMLVVILLLHVNCFAQYALCGLNVGYKRSERPAIGVGICISVAIAAPAIAGIYTSVSPLGKDYDFPTDEEAQVPIPVAITTKSNELSLKSFEKRLSFMVRKDGEIVENRPRWKGGIFDFWDDKSVAFLSIFCSFCVFGWNMERLGFGNMYVHIATFILFCSAPFWIFNLAALNIDDETVRQVLGLSGFVLCALGLFYGGYWRIRMRKRFNLPGYYTSCCGQPAISDCALWLCCCWCSLAQEVRTGNYYDIVEDKLCTKHVDGNVEVETLGLSCENGATDNESCPSSPSEMPSDTVMITTVDPRSKSPVRSTEEDAPREGMAETMKPPSPVLIDREGK